MAPLQYTKAERIWLKNHPDFTEKWLQDRIVDEPAVLGLGEVQLIERERKQDKAGRLDLLFQDEEENTRYEVELMLGATDESHIIRCLEYWDIERRRYPGYEHVAVLVAEDITSRFLNILALFVGTIPLIAIQLNALKIGNQIVLDFVRVIDAQPLRRDDEGEPPPATDRPYWTNRAKNTIDTVDQFLATINEKAESPYELNYNKYYVGLLENGRARNFIHFKPKQNVVQVLGEISDKQGWVERFEEAGLTSSAGRRFVRVSIPRKDISFHTELMKEFLHKALEEYQG